MSKKQTNRSQTPKKKSVAQPTFKPKGKTTPNQRELTEPSRPTVKRLFALSGNRCAFPNCQIPIVDSISGSIVGEICHIKGEKEGSARHDQNQQNSERHSFDNLILLCGRHHKVIDDNESKYPVSFLINVKGKHETGQPKTRALSNEQTDRLIASVPGNRVVNRTTVKTRNQLGGMNANTIINQFTLPTDDEQVTVEGLLNIGAVWNSLKRSAVLG
ncbi:HNH endonuclease [Gemmata sp. G18]|uniref:HNH endonuclease n=1 Tax=Gemmata palustris TaxID=2822762 RepID=A0ABS5BNV7_9BACT|nr:HNH endonuclease signature motif containing protein [Gemmata palustris]MBP3954995.1 HNH endonuclease [Gemmata palustris]